MRTSDAPPCSTNFSHGGSAAPYPENLPRRVGADDLPVWDESGLRQLERDNAAALPDHALMRRAGAAVARLARALHPSARRITVLCGPGNNGGDGLVAAADLARAGRRVEALLVACGADADAHAARRGNDWGLALAQARAAGVEPRPWNGGAAGLGGAELLIDALLGIGLRRAPDGELAAAIGAIAEARLPVLAVDLPSGLAADSGTAPGALVRADATLTLLGLKPGVLTGPAQAACGELWFDDLGARPGATQAAARCLAAARAALPALDRAPHKGVRGDVAVFGGAPGMAGAVLLAARAALSLGAGRVFAAMLDPAAPALDPVWPDLMLRRPDVLLRDLGRGAAVFGPGAGTGAEAATLLGALLARPLPLVIDADGLNLLAAAPRDGALWSTLRGRDAPTWITPHPREAAGLLGVDLAAVQADRLGAARALAEATGAATVLKGAGSVIARPGGGVWINRSGNGLLATAGSGDVLAGAIGAALASGADGAAPAMVWLHGAAADLALRQGAVPHASELPGWMLRAWRG